MPVIDVSDLKLSTKQRKIALHYLTHNNPAAAYQAVYDNNADDIKARTRALVILKNPNVSRYIKSKEQEAAEIACVSIATHIKSLSNLRDLAEIDGKYSAAIKAEEQIGRVSGLYVERTAVDVSGSVGVAVAIVPAKQLIDDTADAVDITIDNQTLTGA